MLPQTGPASTGATEPSFLTFELDRLLWSDDRQRTNNPEVRAEAGRILETGFGRKDMAKDDHDHLVQLVSAQTGLSPTDADHRVAQIIPSRGLPPQRRGRAPLSSVSLWQRRWQQAQPLRGARP
jgi:hypothetical protein